MSKFDTLAREALIAVYETDLQGNILYANKEMADLLEYDSIDELKSRSVISFYKDPDRRRALTEKLEKFGKVRNFEVEFVTRTGRVKHLFLSAVLEGSTILGTIKDVSECLSMRESLKETEENYRRLVEVSPNVIMVLIEGNITFVNNVGVQLAAARSASDLLRRSVLDLVHPDDRRAFSEYFEHLEEERKGGSFEGRFVRFDGQIIHVLISATKFTYHCKHAVQMVVNDISELKRTENILLEREDFLQSVLENIPLYVFWKDTDLVYLGCNKNFARVAGLEAPEDVIGKSDYDLPWKREEADICRANDRQVVEQNAPLLNTLESVHIAGGKPIWAEVNKVPMHDAEGKVTGLIGVFRDVTESKRVEEELRTLSRAIHQSPASIVITDPLGDIEYVNPKFTKVTGYTFEEVKGKNPRILKSGELSQEVYKELWNTITTGGEWRGEFQNKKKNGELFWEYASICPIKDNNGRILHFLAVKEDITEKKSLEAQLIRSQRLESIGILAGGIAHDLNNVLTPILLWAETMRERLSDPDLRRMVEMLVSSAERGAGIVRQVLTFARATEGEQAEVQTRHILKELESIIHDTFPKSLNLEIDCSKDLWTITANATQIHQVLLNLCVNARDAMAGGGTLSLMAENVVLDENYCRMHLEAKPGPHIVLSVTDTGVGIRQGVIDRIFDPFFTTKEIGKGTGLGLSTSLSIVKSHGGFITVYSEVGRGTTFKVYLPALLAFGSAQLTEENLTLYRGQDELVLVIDDEFVIRETIKQMLELYGYRVLTAEDGAEALALYGKHCADVRVVLTDMVMPYMDGPTTIRALRKYNPALKIIATSGLPQHEGIVSTGDLNVQAFLHKPFTTKDLLGSLAKLLDRDIKTK